MSFDMMAKDGEKNKFSLNLEDVVESKASLNDSSERYRLIADHASDMISIIDSDSYCFRYVSPSYQKVLDFEAGELIGNYSFNLVHPDDRANVVKTLVQALDSGYGKTEYRVLGKDGTEIWVETIGKQVDEQDKTRGILLISRDIRERKRVEMELKYSEEKYRLILENAYDMIEKISAEDFSYLYVNQTTLKVLGFNEEDLLGRSSLELVHPKDQEKLLKKYSEGLRNSGEGIAEYRYQKKDGSYLWVEATGKLIMAVNGQKEILIINRDISQRKNAEEELRKSELQLRKITDNMLDSICGLDKNGVFNYVSPSHQSLMGFAPEELMGKKNLYLVHPDDRKRITEYFASRCLEGSNGQIEYRARHKAGHYIWLESFGKVVLDNHSGDKHCVIGTRDITARKQVEEELRKSKQHLQDKLSYLNTLIYTMNELCYIVDRNYRLTFANQKAVDITGFSLEEGIGKSIFEFVPDNDREKIRQRLELRFNQGDQTLYEHVIICKDGSELLIRVKSSPIIENNEITGILILSEDITQQRKVEREMARLGQLNTVGEMAASIGHEIRNPMTAVQGFLQIMGQNEKLIEQQPYFELMLEELGRANSIITEFLSLAKDKMLDLQCRNLNKILTTLAPLLSADAIKDDKYISFVLGDIDDLLLDENEIRQLILNLVRNGLDAMSAGGTISIKTSQEADSVVLAVQDEGGGIAPEIIDKIGTPFLSSKTNGIGLGLAVCYSIVDRHQARMEYETSSKGTIFRVKFIAGSSFN